MQHYDVRNTCIQEKLCKQLHSMWQNGTPAKFVIPSVVTNDVLFIAGLVAYWPARIHDVALLALYCPHMTSGRLAVCYSQIRSILSSATAFPAATLR